MLYIFQGGSHAVQVLVEGKDIKMATEVTNYKFVPIADVIAPIAPNDWEKLKVQLDSFNDARLEKYLIDEFKKMGYTLKTRK